MSQPIYTKPNFNNKVKILINGKKVSEHPAMSKHARYINFISERITPVIKENEETDSFDIDLEKYMYDIIAKYMEDKKQTPPPSSKKIKRDKLKSFS